MIQFLLLIPILLSAQGKCTFESFEEAQLNSDDFQGMKNMTLESEYTFGFWAMNAPMRKTYSLSQQQPYFQELQTIDGLHLFNFQINNQIQTLVFQETGYTKIQNNQQINIIFLMMTIDGLTMYRFPFDYSKIEGKWIFLYCTFSNENLYQFLTFNTGDGSFQNVILNIPFQQKSSSAKLQFGGQGLYTIGQAVLNLDILPGRMSYPIIFDVVKLFYSWQVSDFAEYLSSLSCFMPANCLIQDQQVVLNSVFQSSNLSVFQYSTEFRGNINQIEFWMKRVQVLEQSILEFIFAIGVYRNSINYNIFKLAGLPFDNNYLFAARFDGYYQFPSQKVSEYAYFAFPLKKITSWCFFRYNFIRTSNGDVIVLQLASADGPTIIEGAILQKPYFTQFTNFQGVLTLFTDQDALEPGHYQPLEGKISNFRINYCVPKLNSISPDSDLNCHRLCKTCKGPTQWDCKTCHSEQNRLLLQEKSSCICLKNYQETEGQSICQLKIRNIPQMSQMRKSQQIQCNYGLFSVKNDDGTIVCIQWQQYMLIKAHIYINNQLCAQIVFWIVRIGHKILFVIKNLNNWMGNDLCQGFRTLKSCFQNRFYQNGNCIQCSMNCEVCDNQICIECEIGYYLRDEHCYSCPSNCIDCKFNFMRPECITCSEFYTNVDGECQKCGKNCKQCEIRTLQDSFYLKCLSCEVNTFISLDGVSCYYNTLDYCFTPFQFSKQNIRINTIFYDFQPQKLENILTGCTYCHSYAFLDFDNNFKCSPLQAGNFNPQCYYAIVLNGIKSCKLSPLVYGFCQQAYPNCQFCYIQHNSIVKYCLYCSKGYYNDYYTSFCFPCPEQCLSCYQSDSSKIIKLIQMTSINLILKLSYFQFLDLTQNPNPQHVQIFCTQCTEGYQLYDNKCRINCPSNCKECKYVNDIPFCLSCLELDEYSYITLENGQCISCPTNCKLCKSRSAEEQAKINPYFSNQKFQFFSNHCVVPFDASLFYDQKIKQFINCENCEKYVDIVFDVDCNSNIEKEQFKIKIDTLFNNNVHNYLSDIETQEYYLYLNQEYVKQVNYKFNLEPHSVCTLNAKTYFQSTLQQNVFNLPEINFLLEGNNSTLILNGNIKLNNFTSIKIQNLKIQNGAFITNNIKGYQIQLENISVTGSLNGMALTDQIETTFQFNQANSVLLKNIDILNMKYTKLSQLIVVDSSNFMVTLDCQNINLRTSEFYQTQLFSFQVAKLTATFKSIYIEKTLIISSQFITELSNSHLQLKRITIIDSQIINSNSFFLVQDVTLFDSLNVSTSTIKNSNLIQAEKGLDLVNSNFFNLQIQGNSTLLQFGLLKQDSRFTVLRTNFRDIEYQEQQSIMFVSKFDNFAISVNFNQVNLINISLAWSLMQLNYQASIKQSIFYIDCSKVLFDNVNITKGLGFPEFSILNVLNFTFINSNIKLDDLYQFKSINPALNCSIVQASRFYFRTFIYFSNVQKTYLENVTFQNLIIYDSAFMDYKQTIQLNNSLISMIGCEFLSNVIHKTETDSRVSLFKIESSAELQIKFDNDQFNKNLLLITVSESSSNEGLLFTVISSNCKISNSKFSSNMIINGQSSIFQINSNEIQIESSIFEQNSIFVYETLKQFLVWGFESVVFQEDLQQLFPSKSLGGNGNLKASKISITNSQIVRSYSRFGGAFAITLLENGFLQVQNSSFKNISLDMSDNSQGGCLYISSNAKILNIEIFKSTFQFIEARESGGLLFLQISTLTPKITFIDSIFSNIFALQGSLAYIMQTQSGDPMFSLKNCKIENQEQYLQNFVNNIQQITNLELTILTQYFSLIYFTDGLIEIENITITQYPLLQFLHTQNSVHIKGVQMINILFARPLFTFNTNINSKIIKINSLNLINCTMVEEIKINKIQAFSSKSIKSSCVDAELPSSVPLAGYSLGSLNYQLLVQMLLFQPIQGVMSFSDFKDSDIIEINQLSIQIFCKNCKFGVLGFLNQQKTNIRITGLTISNSICGNLGCLHINSENNRILNENGMTRRNSILIRNLICVNNEANYGGCLYLMNQQISIQEGFISNNSAILGGAIYIQGDSTILDANNLSIFINNATQGSGIYSSNNYLTQKEGISFFDNIGQTVYTKPSQLQIQFLPDLIITPIITFKDQYNVKSKVLSKDGIETTVYLPTGIEIQKYRRFSMKYNQYSSDFQILRLFSLTKTLETIDLTGTFCNCWVTDLNGVKYYNLTNKNTFYFDKEFYDFGDLILYIPQNKGRQFWLQFWCNSIFSPIIIDDLVIGYHQNYTLQLKIKPYECQLGEYHSGQEDYCHQCQIDQKQYSITLESTQCTTQNDSLIKEITPAQVKLNKGYWRYQITSSTFDSCLNSQENCVGGWAVGNNLCLTGYIGALCEQCDAYNVRGDGSHYRSEQFKCLPCKNFYLNARAQVIGSTLIFIIFMLFFFSLKNKGQLTALSLSLTKAQQTQLKESISLQYIKLIIQYFQIISLLAELYLIYEDGFQKFIDILGNPFEMNFFNFCFVSESDLEIVYFDLFSNTIILIIVLIGVFIIFMFYQRYKGQPNLSKQRMLDFAYLAYLFYASSIVRCVLKLIGFRNIQHFMWIQQNVAYLYTTSIHLKLVFCIFLPFLIIFSVLFSINLHLQERKINQKKIIEWGIWYQAFKDCQQESLKIITLILIHFCIIFVDGDYSLRCLMAFSVLTVYYQTTYYKQPYCSNPQNLFEMRLILFSLSSMVLNIFYRVVTTQIIKDIIRSFSYLLIYSSFILIIQGIQKSGIIPVEKMMKVVNRVLIKRFPSLQNNNFFYKYSEIAEKQKIRRLTMLRNYLSKASKESLEYKRKN